MVVKSERFAILISLANFFSPLINLSEKENFIWTWIKTTASNASVLFAHWSLSYFSSAFNLSTIIVNVKLRSPAGPYERECVCVEFLINKKIINNDWWTRTISAVVLHDGRATRHTQHVSEIQRQKKHKESCLFRLNYQSSMRAHIRIEKQNLSSYIELRAVHLTLLCAGLLALKRPATDNRPRATERRSDEFSLRRTTRCWLEKRLTFDQQKRIKNVRIVGRRRAFNSTIEGNIMSIDPLSAGFLICFWQEALTRLALANFIYSLLLLHVSLLTTQERETSTTHA